MNTEALKAAHQAALLAIYVPGERYALAKQNGLHTRTLKALKALHGVVGPSNKLNGQVNEWSREVRKSLNVDLRNNPGYKEFC